MAKRVCIVGGGPSGLTSIKACLEEGVTPVCYEKTSHFGGLWRYSDDPECPSVWKSTVVNSSKELTAFSDFPPPPEMPNFMHRTKMLNYIEEYTKHFDLERHIKFNHEVFNINYSKDYDVTGRWCVQIKNKKNEIFEEIFDAVLICNGHHVEPAIPSFQGLDNFEGEKIHTKAYRVPHGYEDKRIVVIGIGNSGGDIAVELSRFASTVYVSTRRGSWIVNRVGTKGYPLDTILVTRFNDSLKKFLPWGMSNNALELTANNRFDHSDYCLRPRHRIFEQHMTVNDDLPNRIACGTLVIKSDIHHFTKHGVVFKDEEDVEYPVDVVLLATGYNITFPFLSKEILDVRNNEVTLYKLVFPPQLKHPTLAVIGLYQPLGPVFPIFEMQGRWVLQVLQGHCKLPDEESMRQDIKSRNEYVKKYFVNSLRYTIQVDYISYMDSLAEMFGAKPNLKKIFFEDPRLFLRMYFGPCYSYQYRIAGPHKWPEATKAIIKGKERILAPINTRKGDTLKITPSFFLLRIILGIVFVGHMVFTMFQLSVM